MADDPRAWAEITAAIVAAAAALTGLIFVALSINLDPIIRLGGVADVALQAIAVLTVVLMTGALVLVPGQSKSLLAGELVLLGVGLIVVVAWLFVRTWRDSDAAYRGKRLQTAILNALPGLGFGIAGVSLALGTGGGLYWLVPGWTLGMLAGIVNAWILLVEVKR